MFLFCLAFWSSYISYELVMWWYLERSWCLEAECFFGLDYIQYVLYLILKQMAPSSLVVILTWFWFSIFAIMLWSAQKTRPYRQSYHCSCDPVKYDVIGFVKRSRDFTVLLVFLGNIFHVVCMYSSWIFLTFYLCPHWEYCEHERQVKCFTFFHTSTSASNMLIFFRFCDHILFMRVNKVNCIE